MKIFVAVLGALVMVAVQAQEQDAEFVPGGPSRRPTIFSRPRPDRPQFGDDEPGLVFVRIPTRTVSNNRPSLIDILTRAFRGDDSCCGGDADIFPFFGTDRPGSSRPAGNRPVFIRPGANEDRPPQNLFPFPDFSIFDKPQPDTPSFGIFDDFFNSFGPRIPQGPTLTGFDFNIDDLPDTYDNKTHTVETIDGNRVEVNSTIKKDGDSFFHFHVVKLGPTDESSGSPQDVDITNTTDASSSSTDAPISPTSSTVSEAVPEVTTEVTTEPYEDFGEKHGRVKRFSLPSILTRYFGTKTTTEAPLYITSVNSPSNHIDIDLDSPRIYEIENETPQSPVLVDLSGDTRVNYVARNVESEALVDDVEIFDWDLVREEARKHRFNNNQLQSASLKAHPMGIYSVMSEPINSDTEVITDTLGHHRHRYNPAIYQSSRLQSMSSHPMSAQPMRSQSMRSQPMISQSMRSQPMRSQPMRFQPMNSQQIESQSLRSQTSEQIPSVVYNSPVPYALRHERSRPKF